jgi:hypothetical protein
VRLTVTVSVRPNTGYGSTLGGGVPVGSVDILQLGITMGTGDKAAGAWC